MPRPASRALYFSAFQGQPAAEPVHFSNQFIGRAAQREFLVWNMGRKPQVLSWIWDRPAKKNQNRGSKEPPPPEEEYAFSIFPEKATVQPKSSCVFTLTALSRTKAGSLSDKLLCKSAAGGRDGTVVYDFLVDGEFAPPIVELSSPSLTFVYHYVAGAVVRPLVQPLTIRNVSPLPVGFSLQLPAPFSVDRPNWQLEPQEQATVDVFFEVVRMH